MKDPDHGIIHVMEDRRFRFGDFELDGSAGRLRRAGLPLKLQPQPLKALILLVRRRGELITREELRQAVWGNSTHVDFDQGLNYCVRQIRRVLQDNAEAPKFVETVPRAGYRFIADVQVLPNFVVNEVGEQPADLPAASHPWWWVSAAFAMSSLGIVLILLSGVIPEPYTAQAFSNSRYSPITVAVLPFTSLGPDHSADGLGDGIGEEIMTQLSRISGLNVVSGNIAQSRAPPLLPGMSSVVQPGRVVDGSVRQEGNRLRVTVRLLAPANGRVLWSEIYTGTTDDILKVQEEIAKAASRALKNNLPVPQ